MRHMMVMAFAIALVGLVPRNAAAETRYPWCAYYDGWSYNCGFTSFQQCLATISGAGGACRPNPYGAPAASSRGKPHAQARQRY